MPYDKDLRDLLKATKKVAEPVPKTVAERVEKSHIEFLLEKAAQLRAIAQGLFKTAPATAQEMLNFAVDLEADARQHAETITDTKE